MLITRRQEFHTHWRGNFQRLPGGGKLPGHRVNGEDHEVVRVLIGGDEEFTFMLDAEIARGFAECSLSLNEGECSFFPVNRKNRDTVVAAIGGVKEFAGGRNGDFGRGIFACKIGGQSGNGLSFAERAGAGSGSGTRDGGTEFADEVSVAVIG